MSDAATEVYDEMSAKIAADATLTALLGRIRRNPEEDERRHPKPYWTIDVRTTARFVAAGVVGRTVRARITVYVSKGQQSKLNSIAEGLDAEFTRFSLATGVLRSTPEWDLVYIKPVSSQNLELQAVNSDRPQIFDYEIVAFPTGSGLIHGGEGGISGGGLDANDFLGFTYIKNLQTFNRPFQFEQPGDVGETGDVPRIDSGGTTERGSLLILASGVPTSIGLKSTFSFIFDVPADSKLTGDVYFNNVRRVVNLTSIQIDEIRWEATGELS